MGVFSKYGRKFEASDYVAVAAGVTTAAVGSIGCYLEGVTVVPGSTSAGAVTILDGSTAIVTIPTLAGTGTGTQVQAPYFVHLGIRATNTSTGFKITTGTSVTVVAIGKFST
jgi:hypothetical protein